MDLVGHQAVRLAVHGIRSLGVGRADEAVDGAGLLIDPVLLVVDAVLALHLQVGLVGLRDVDGLDPTLDVVDVHVERHDVLLRNIPVLARRRCREVRRGCPQQTPSGGHWPWVTTTYLGPAPYLSRPSPDLRRRAPRPPGWPRRAW